MVKGIELNFERHEENLGYLLWQTTMIWQRQMNKALHEVNLTHTQFVILAALAWLSKKSESVTQKEIADYSSTDRMMVSKILRTLQKNGLIERKEHHTDTRAKCVFLTTEGLYILKKAFIIKVQANDLFFDKLLDKQKFGKELSQLISLK